MIEELSIHQLVLRTARRDAHSFEALYNRLSQPLASYLIQKYCPPLQRADIEDALQYTFIQVWRYAPRYRGKYGEKSARNWVYKIARHQVIKMVTVARDMNVVSLEEETESRDTESGYSTYQLEVAAPDDTEKQALTAILVEKVLLFVDSLTERDRMVFLLHYNDATFEQIGKQIGLTKPRAKQIWDAIIHRANRLLGKDK